MEHLLNSEVLFVINRSFFPEKSHLIAAIWYISVSGKVVARGDSISSIAEEYRHIYSAEL